MTITSVGKKYGYRQVNNLTTGNLADLGTIATRKEDFQGILFYNRVGSMYVTHV